ncbi:MAG: hypothetical protein JO204_13215 [Alphaproteobacteria bacterium]|nr:hypothetical protein [Alphaproteobacteria bacterium]
MSKSNSERGRTVDWMPSAGRRAFLAGVLGSLVGGMASQAQSTSPFLTFVYGRHFNSAEHKALEAWSNMLARLADSWWPTITTRLASPGFKPARQIAIKFTDIHIRNVPALTHGSVIEVDAGSLLTRLNDPDTLAMIAHEMVHVAQRYRRGPGWLAEGIADYMRYYVLLPDDPSRAFRPEHATWHDGYQPTAGFLDWAEQGHPGTITRVNAALRAGEDGEALLRDTLGQPLEAAWAAYLASKPFAITPEAWRQRTAVQPWLIGRS